MKTRLARIAPALLLSAVASAAVGLTALMPITAQADPVVSGQCSTVGDVASQIAGWRNIHKTKAQAYAQIDKYYSDPTDRKVLYQVTDKIYLDPHKRLVPDQIGVEITSSCATGEFTH